MFRANAVLAEELKGPRALQALCPHSRTQADAGFTRSGAPCSCQRPPTPDKGEDHTLKASPGGD